MARPGKDEVAAAFAPEGPLARAFDGYEFRESQVGMALAVWRAFSTSRHALIESGTGTGKSMAYLVPAVLWARGMDEKVVVSTNTINLQEQLIHKDLPDLSRALGVQFHFVLVKGRANYICRRKLASVAIEIEETSADPSLRDALATLLAELPHVATGSRSDFPSTVPAVLWDRIASDSMSCLRAKCPYQSLCYFVRARAAMEEADILITNHHLLFSDLALRTASPGASGARVLPEYQYVVFDEAHNVPNVAAERLGYRASLAQIRRVCQDLSRVERERRGEGGLLSSVRTRVFQGMGGLADGDVATVARLVDEAIEGAKRVRESVESFFDAFRRAMGTGRGCGEGQGSTDAGSGRDGGRDRGCGRGRSRESERERGDQWAVRLKGQIVASRLWQEEVLPAAERVSIRAGELSRGLGSILDSLADLGNDDDDLQSAMADLQGAAGRISSEAAALDFVISQPDDAYVYWAEMTPRDTALVATPLDVGPVLAERLFSHVESAVLTSATMTVRGEFGFFRRQVGLTGLDEPPTESIFESPFDLRTQALLAVACDLPQPQDPGFADMAARAIVDIVIASRGRAFVLFTSIDMLFRTHEAIRDRLEAAGIPVLRQGDLPRHRMLAHFREKPGVLLGADSFWQGVDVPGEALSCVILVKLPFQVPTSPVVEAKLEAAEKAGSSGFYSYALPSAVVRFRQGFGRLVRSREDRGVVVVLDRRLVERPYGRVFLSSLPGVTCFTGTTAEVASSVRDWIGQAQGPKPGTAGAPCIHRQP
ncbi:MAG: ATP-dependent DNA helicase [Bacteroidota bacterium]